MLITGTLTSQDIENRASYDGQSMQLGGGFNFGGGAAGGKAGGKDGVKGGGSGGSQSAIGTDNQGNVAGGSKATPGSTLPSFDGVSANVPIAMGASGEASSTTKSAISGGTLVIRDEAGQKALTGQTAAEAIAALNRDTKDTLNALDRIFDEKEVRAGFEVAKTLAQETGTFLANRAAEADALKRAIDAAPPGPYRTELEGQYAQVRNWGMGGEYRQLLTAFVAAAGGNVTGGVGQLVQAAGVNYLQSLGAAQIKEISASLGGEGSPAHIALQAVLACGGAAGQGASCSAGAIGASASIVISGLLDKLQGEASGGLTPEDREARANLLSTILAGISSALSSEQVASLVSAGRIEVENNTLKDYTKVSTPLFAEKVKGLAECIGDRSCQTAAEHFLGWIKVIDEQDLPACQGDVTCVKNRALEREAYLQGYASATARLSDPLIAGMDLLDATPGAEAFDRFKLKDALVRFRNGTPDYTSKADQFVANTMSSSLVVIAAQDPRLAAAVRGSGSSNPNFSVGEGTYVEAERLGKIWVGDGAQPLKGIPGGYISADGARVYRPPTAKPNTPIEYNPTGIQANFQLRDPRTGAFLSNGHLIVK